MSEYTKRFVDTLPSGELPALPELDVDDLRFALRVIGQFCPPRTSGFNLDCNNGITLRAADGHAINGGWDKVAHVLFASLEGEELR